MRKILVAISREYGSGGREVGRRLAEILDIPFYDKELIAVISKESGIDEDLFSKISDKVTFENFYFGPSGNATVHGSLGALGALSLQERMYHVSSEVIKRVAQESCVIVGRCSDYILRNDPDIIRVFIRAELADKKKRAGKVYGEHEDNIGETLLRMDKKRAAFYNYYSDGVWGKLSNYDLVINTSKVGLSNAALVIKEYAERRVIDENEE